MPSCSAGHSAAWPSALLACAATAALLAAAGPIVPLRASTRHPVVLIIDVSRSMEESDITPTRIETARSAAREFAGHLPRQSRVALVTFGNYASVVVPLSLIPLLGTDLYRWVNEHGYFVTPPEEYLNDPTHWQNDARWDHRPVFATPELSYARRVEALAYVSDVQRTIRERAVTRKAAGASGAAASAAGA